MTPTLHPFQHRVDTFLVNEPLLLWSLRQSVWARGMAHPQVVGSDNLLVRLALPGLVNAAGHAAIPTPYSHTEGRLLSYDAEAARWRLSSATTPWQRARRQHTSRTRHGMASNPRRRSSSRRSCEVRRPDSARPRRASYRRSWRGKQPPSKRTSATCAHSWRLTASGPLKISGAATPRTSPSGGKPCGGP